MPTLHANPRERVRLREAARWSLLLFAASCFGTAAVVEAAEQTWSVTSGTWTDGASWASGTAPASSTTADTAFFSSTAADATAYIGAANRSVAGLVFGASGATSILNNSGANKVLTLGASGITLNSGAGPVVIGNITTPQWVSITLSGSQTWANDSASLFTLNNRLTIPGGNRLALAGPGDWLLREISGTGSMLVDIGGRASFNGGSPNWIGGLTIASGTVAFAATSALGTGSSTITIENGWLDATSPTAAQRTPQAAMVWKGNVGFVGGNTLTATNTVTLAAESTVTTSGSTITIDSGVGQAGGAFGFTKLGSGTLVLNAANTYAGTTRINGGTLRLGANGTLDSSPLVVVGGTAGASAAVLDLTAKTGTFSFLVTQTVGGIGTVNIGAGKTVAVAGRWAPGNSIGSNAVTGNLAVSGTSEFELGTPGSSTSSPGDSDFTAVSGTLTLGGTLDLRDNAGAGGLGSAAGGVYRLFTYGGAVTGSYAAVTAPTAATRVGPGTISLGGSGTTAGRGVFVTVFNKAAPNTLSGTLNLGTVLRNTSLAQPLSIANTAPADGFSESLNASFGTLVSASAAGSISQLVAGGTNSSGMIVGLDTSTAGAKTGSAELNFATDGGGTSGLGLLSLDSQTVSLAGTVLDPAVASFASGSTSTSLLVTLPSIAVGGTATQAFDIYNLLQTVGFTADLALVQIDADPGNTGSLFTNLATFSDLAAADFRTFTATLEGTTSGFFTNSWTLTFKSANGGTVYAADAPQLMTLTLSGLVAIPEPASIVLAALGAGGAAWGLRRRRAGRRGES